MHTIETLRLWLRPFTADDLDDLHQRIYADAEVMRYLPGGVPRPVEKTIAAIEAFQQHDAEHGYTIAAVIDKETDQLMGHCGLWRLEVDHTIEVAYALGRAYWGQGFATEAAQATLRYGFEVCGLPQIVALAFPENIASQRVIQKIGMQHIGPTRRYYNTDLILYLLANQDFMADAAPYNITETHDRAHD